MSKITILLGLSLFFAGNSCQTSGPANSEVAPKVSTPVTVLSVGNAPISSMLRLNATTQYQRKNTVKSIINGYIVKSFVNQGDVVRAGKPLYAIQTKEGDALSKFAARDSSFAFTGKHTIVAPTSGIVVEVTKQTNDYISDGEQLCVIAEQNSFVFLLNVPFELNKFTLPGQKCSVILPDSTVIDGVISGKLSAVDPVSQTQSYIVKPLKSVIIPENLSTIVQITKNSKTSAQVIDKSCVLADETMENFWVMKLINDSTAVKVAIKTGITEDNKIEILSPTFTLRDRIVSTGNYGLPDTAFVNIIQP